MSGTSPPGPVPTPRLASLDALRGFDMMWIMGADALGSALSQFRGGGGARFAATQLDHVAWAGVRFYDLIFPLFVFMVGVAIPYSLDRIVAAGGRPDAVRRVARRTVLLFLLGIFYYGGFATALHELRLLGVLQRIALCYGAASLAYLWMKPRGLVVTVCGILIGYWALLTFVPVPGIGPPSYARGVNLAHYLDVHFLPGRSVSDTAEFEGSLLNTLGAVANCLLGVFAGLLMQSGRLPARRKVLWLGGGGALSLALGYLWGLQFPIIKLLWTSSYVLVSCGYSAILLGGFYLVIDIWRIQEWAQPLVWVGMNPLTIYLVAGIVSFPTVAQRLLGGAVFFGAYGGVVVALASLGLELWFVQFLYSRKIFLRL